MPKLNLKQIAYGGGLYGGGLSNILGGREAGKGVGKGTATAVSSLIIGEQV
jgi:hypothetical protein